MPHVIWDWNGTLFDDVPLVVEAVNACLHSRGATGIGHDLYRDRFERPLNRFYEGLLGYPVDDELLHELDIVFQSTYDAGFTGVGLNRESEEAVHRVASAGASQSIASMLSHTVLVPTVRRFGIDEYMVALDGNRGLVGDTKERHMAQHIARLGELFPDIDTDSITVIGDIADDALAAASAGVDCVLYDGGSQARSKLLECGVPVVDSLLGAVAVALGDRMADPDSGDD